MTKKMLILTLSLCAATAIAQDTSKVPQYGWKHTLITSLALTQVAFTDWAQGGENALAYGLALQGKSVQDELQTNWTTSYNFAFGQTRLGDQGIRKTDDKIDLETILAYKLGGNINPYAAASFKSQFARGYKYDAAGGSIAVSQFFDPAYLTQSVGAVYTPIPQIKTRLGLAVREVFASDFAALYTDDLATTAVEKSRVDGGLESVTEVEWHLDENIVLTSKLELFSAFKTMDQVVVRNDNTIAAKVNKYISVNFNVQLINEPRVSPRTQFKEGIAIGFSYNLL